MGFETFLSPGFFSKPWITKGIKKSISIRDKLYKEMIKVKNVLTKVWKHESFKKYQNQIINLLRVSKQTHYNKYFKENKNNCRAIWIGINEVICPKNKRKLNSPTSLIDEDKTITNPKNIVEHFNKFFIKIGTNIEIKISPTKKYYTDYLLNPSKETFLITPTTDEAISHIIYDLRIRKSTGPNSIPTKVMKQIKDVISALLAKLTNISFHNGVFPSIHKIAKVIPIFKSESRVACNNYRSISLFSNIGKIIEKLMHKLLHSFLETQNCFYLAQFGFRLNVSANNALMSMTETIQTKLDKGKSCARVFVDLKKALDTVDHNILWRKLDYYGIRGIANKWFCSYLKKRKQFVSIENNTSSVKEILTGVPQGSVLGPLLFLIYINDLHKSIRFSNTYHFTDDTSIIQSNPSLKRLSKQVNKDLANLSNWLRTNKLSPNVKKTELVIFRPRKRKRDHGFKFKLDGKRLVPTNSVKYLGALIDELLLWNKQITQIKMRLKQASN